MTIGKRDSEIFKQIYFTLALDPTSFIYRNISRLNPLNSQILNKPLRF